LTQLPPKVQQGLALIVVLYIIPYD